VNREHGDHDHTHPDLGKERLDKEGK
jgi:hypothetical protein